MSFETIAAAVLFVLVLICIRLALRLRTKPTPSEALPDNAIIVDGSNAMHWNGDPSEKVLIRVVQTLKGKGYNPIVIFDANVGYKLRDRYLDDKPMAKMIGLPVAQVLVVEKGIVADQVILDFAAESGLRIVTNDRFRDWSVRYNFIKDKGRLVRGEIREGTVMMKTL